jgi:serine beta-lactamase-like protein LACTB
MKKFFAAAFIAYLLLAATAWFIADARGWQEIPADAPGDSQLFDAFYAAPAQRASELFRRAPAELGVVGVTAAISVGGKLVWTSAAGWSDLEARRQITSVTVMRIGATSKAITATLLARLVEQGVMSLDAPIGDYFDALPNTAWKSLTPRQLAAHTAGFPDDSANRDLWGRWQTFTLARHFDDVGDSLAIFDDNALRYEPGTQFGYSSFDVTLLGAAMQAATGEPYLKLLDREVLEPLQMHSTQGDHAGPQPAALARFYDSRHSQVKRWREVDLSQQWPSAGLLSTSADLSRLCNAWFDTSQIDAATAARFWEPQKLASGAVNPQAYAIGWRAEPVSQVLGVDLPTPRYHHGGVSAGATSWLVCYPEVALGVAINVNTRLVDTSVLPNLEARLTRPFFEYARLRRQGPSELL